MKKERGGGRDDVTGMKMRDGEKKKKEECQRR